MTGTVVIKNLTAQSREVIFHDGKSPVHYWLKGHDCVRIPKDFLTPTVLEVARRKVISIKKDK
jgi:hypothetical protein